MTTSLFLEIGNLPQTKMSLYTLFLERFMRARVRAQYSALPVFFQSLKYFVGFWCLFFLQLFVSHRKIFANPLFPARIWRNFLTCQSIKGKRLCFSILFHHTSQLCPTFPKGRKKSFLHPLLQLRWLYTHYEQIKDQHLIQLISHQHRLHTWSQYQNENVGDDLSFLPRWVALSLLQKIFWPVFHHLLMSSQHKPFLHRSQKE